MPKTYKTSDKMKKDILRVAGKFFREYGYDKTTYQMISDELGISKSAIAYHFNTKPWIIFNLCMNYVKEVYAYVKKELSTVEDFNTFRYHSTAQLIIYRELLSKGYNRALFFHRDHLSIWGNERFYLVENYYKEIILDFKKYAEDETVRLTAVMSNGAKLNLLMDFVKNPDESKIDMYVGHLLYLIGLLAVLDVATIVRNLDSAFEFADSHELPIPGLLV